MPFEVIGGVPLIFIHIPKNAGTSIKKYFDMQRTCHLTAQHFLNSMKEGTVPLTLNTDEDRAELLKRTNRSFRNMETKGENPFRKPFKFCFVRNPWDRFVSIYRYHKDDFGGLGTFEDFIQQLKERSGPIFSPSAATILKLTQTQYISISPEFETLVTNNNSLNIEYPSERQAQLAMDAIYRVENIADGVEKISQYIEKNYNGGDRHWLNHRKPFAYHERNGNPEEVRHTTFYKDFDAIYAVFDYYFHDMVNFEYTFSGYANCEITKECLNQKVRELTQSPPPKDTLSAT